MQVLESRRLISQVPVMAKKNATQYAMTTFLYLRRHAPSLPPNTLLQARFMTFQRVTSVR